MNYVTVHDLEIGNKRWKTGNPLRVQEIHYEIYFHKILL